MPKNNNNEKILLSKAKILWQRLFKLGTQVESEETDKIRDELDEIWYNLSNEGCNELNRFVVSLQTQQKK